MVAESLQPGINILELARRWGVHRGLLQTWRRVALREADRGGRFVPLRIEDPSSYALAEEPLRKPADVLSGGGRSTEPARMELEGAGLRVRFTGPVDTAALG